MVDDEWGTPVSVDKVAAATEQNPDAKIVAFVHAETSTGACSDAKAIGQLAKQHGMLTIVDAVTSLGGVPLLVDEWQLDAVYSGSQKCLSCVPGLSPISFSQNAVEKIQSRRSKPQSWFCDIGLLMQYYVGGDGARAYHHTAPVNSLFAIDAALSMGLDEGLEARWERHQRVAAYLYEKLESMGLKLLVKEESRLAPLTLVQIPEGVDDAGVRRELLNQHDIEIGAGLGMFAGTAWRIGLMGQNATIQNVDSITSCLAECL